MLPPGSRRQIPAAPIPFVSLLKHYSTRKAFVHPHKYPLPTFRCAPSPTFARKAESANPAANTRSPGPRCPEPRPPQSPGLPRALRSDSSLPPRRRLARGSHANSAPHRAASSRRVSMVSVAATRAPVRCVSIVNISPIGPCPSTTTKSSGCGSHCTTAFRQVFSGSTSVARSNETSSGIRSTPASTIQSITRTYWAKPPPAGSNPAVIPTFLYTGHCAYILRWQ